MKSWFQECNERSIIKEQNGRLPSAHRAYNSGFCLVCGRLLDGGINLSNTSLIKSKRSNNSSFVPGKIEGINQRSVMIIKKLDSAFG